jgi:hypothetical protein
MKVFARIIALLLAVTIGVVIGASGSTAETAAPVVKTKTVTETVEVTPQSCLDALDAAEGVVSSAADYVNLTVQWPRLVLRALRAGVNMDMTAVDNITADINGLTADTRAITADVRPQVKQFNSAEDACRAAG